MRKKLLIVASALNVDGGIGNCLLNMIRAIEDMDTDYAIDLLLYDTDAGIALEREYNNLRVLPMEYSVDLSISSKTMLTKALKGNHSIRRFQVLYGRMQFKRRCPLPLMSVTAAAIKPLSEEYDMAIAYNVVPSYITTYVAQYVKAKEKIAWSHSDINQDVFRLMTRKTTSEMKGLSGYKKMLQKFDKVVAVSDGVKESIQHEIIGEDYPVQVIYNIVNKSRVVQKSKEKTEWTECFRNQDTIALLTVGRISIEKGIVLALEAMRMLKEDGYHFTWYFVGQNQESELVHNYIEKNGLQDYFVELGVKKNPYPYFKECDIYVHTSFIEGFCTTTNEARMLGKPIVTTDVAGAHEQVINGVNGFVVDKASEAIYKAVKKLIDSDVLRRQFGEYNANLQFDNQESINQIRELLK